MKIREIIIYSHSGAIRRITFKTSGLNIITGRSSTGKSALSDIIEYCMGRSSFNIPEGTIRDKVAWYAVIYQFPGEQVLVAKPAPASSAASCSKAMIKRGASVDPPPYSELHQDCDDNTVVSLLSELLGIHSNRTQVDQDHSRASYQANIKHTYFYLFQKQGLITNKEQLFYRQNEQFMPQAIKDTMPILLGAVPSNRLEIDSKLRAAKRNLKIAKKRLSDALEFHEQLDDRALGLLSEAQQVGLFVQNSVVTTTDEALKKLSEIVKWKPSPVPDEDTHRIAELEDEVAVIRKLRVKTNETLRATRLFIQREDGFSTEAQEQKSRLESIFALPQPSDTKEWNWPFVPVDFGLKTPIAEALIQEIESLDQELKEVAGTRPNLDEFAQNIEKQLNELNMELHSKEAELSAAIAANEAIAEMGSRNAAAAMAVGRISLFLETFRPNDELMSLKTKVLELQSIVSKLENESGLDDSSERMKSIVNIISNQISIYVRKLGAEFSEFDFRFDSENLTVVADRPDRPIPMIKTGGGENHLAYHLGALLSFHRFTTKNKKPIPSFLFLDQPTQVYFPTEQIYKAASGTVEETEKDADLEKVRKLFSMLYQFTTQEVPGFQIIVVEHANLRDDWFQDSIIEEPWTKPPALVPDDWEALE